MIHTKSAFRRKSALTVALVVVLVLVGPAAGSVAAGAPPEPPHRFFGTVTNQNDDPVDGVTIQVYYQGEVVASDTTDSEGYYDLKVPADSIDTEESTEITLTTSQGSASVDRTWKAGGSAELDFEISVEQDPTETPTPEPPDGGDGDGDTGDGDTGGGTGGGDTGGGDTGGGGQGGADGASADVVLTNTGATINVRDAGIGSTIRATLPDGGVSSDIGSVTGIGLKMRFGDDDFRLELTPPQASPPEGIPALDGAMGYFNVDKFNVDDSSIESATINFSVSSLPEGVSPDEVVLYRYHDGEWQPLETSHVSGNAYTATTPGFSTFAIGTVQETPTATPTPSDPTTDQPTATPTETATDQPTDTATASTTPGDEGNGGNAVLIVGIIAVLALLGGAYWYREQ